MQAAQAPRLDRRPRPEGSQTHGFDPLTPWRNSTPGGQGVAPDARVRTSSRPQSWDRGSAPVIAALSLPRWQTASQWCVNWSESQPAARAAAICVVYVCERAVATRVSVSEPYVA